MRRIALALAALMLMASCSSNDLADQGQKSRAGKDKKNEAAGKQNGAGGRKNKGAGGASGGNGNDAEDAQDEIDAAAPGGGSGSEAPQDFGGGDAPSSGIDRSLARAGTSVQDSTSDAKSQGVTPPYAEATGVSIQGLGKNVRLTMTFSGAVPERVQKDQYMVLAFGLTGRKKDEGFAVGATCDDKGWKPYAGKKGDNQELPGSFEVDGNQVIMELPWSFLEGPRAFEWYASTGWYGTVAKQTHWSFDSVPNGEAGNFPAR